MLDSLFLSQRTTSDNDFVARTETATTWKKQDAFKLVPILLSLAHLHQVRGQGIGNITADSLRRGNNGQLILCVSEQSPSICEQSQRGAPECRYFINVGKAPTYEDDLISLGVTIAELLVPPANRPHVDDSYRKQLAERLPKAYFPTSRQTKRLVKKLLCFDKSSYSSTSEFLNAEIGPITLQSTDFGLIVRPIGWWDVLKRRGVFASLGIFVLIILMLGFLYLDSKSKLKIAIDKLSESKVVQIDSPPPPPETPIDAGPNRYKGNERYIAFKDDDNLTLDRTFQDLIEKETLTKDESKRINQKLTDLDSASKVWWEVVKERMDSGAFDKKIAAQEAGVKEILQKWRSRSLTGTDERIKITKQSCPSTYEGYTIGITVGDPITEQYAHRRFTVKDGKLVPNDGNSEFSFEITWKANKPIKIWVEYWSSWKAHWPNLLEFQADGEQALSVFAGLQQSFYDFNFEFDVEPYTGPPTSTRNVLRAPITESDLLSTESSEQATNSIDVLKEFK